MTTLQDQQKSSPTPQRQIEIFNLSAQVTQANGAVTIANQQPGYGEEEITKRWAGNSRRRRRDGWAVQAAPVAVSK